MKENVIVDKSLDFAVRVVNLRKFLVKEHNEYVMSKQLLRCGTSIGANVAEAQQAQSTADFISKLTIALKEASETNYWLRLLNATKYITNTEFSSLIADCREIEKLLTSIIKSSKKTPE